MRFIHQGFVYHNNVVAGNPPLRAAVEAERRSLSMAHRAAQDVQRHNHPPDLNAEEKEAFLVELKRAATSESMEGVTLKRIYETVAEAFPRAASEIPFKSDLLNRDLRTSVRKLPSEDEVLQERLIKRKTCYTCPPRIKRKTFYFCKLCYKPTCLECASKICKNYIRTEDLLQKIKGKPDMPRYIVNGFVFHVNITKGNPRMIYLRCLEYKRLGCHARAVIPYDGSVQDIKVNKPHNHPPDHAAEEKIVFLRELKEVTFKNPSVPSRTIYTTLAEV
nr:unnamed protein product [Callosobruchus analis]